MTMKRRTASSQMEETDRPAGDLVLVSITAADMDPATAAGTPGGVHKLFESDEDESDAQLGEAGGSPTSQRWSTGSPNCG